MDVSSFVSNANGPASRLASGIVSIVIIMVFAIQLFDTNISLPLEFNVLLFSVLMFHIIGNIISSMLEFRKNNVRIVCPYYGKQKMKKK